MGAKRKSKHMKFQEKCMSKQTKRRERIRRKKIRRENEVCDWGTRGKNAIIVEER